MHGFSSFPRLRALLATKSARMLALTAPGPTHDECVSDLSSAKGGERGLRVAEAQVGSVQWLDVSSILAQRSPFSVAAHTPPTLPSPFKAFA